MVFLDDKNCFLKKISLSLVSQNIKFGFKPFYVVDQSRKVFIKN